MTDNVQDSWLADYRKRFQPTITDAHISEIRKLTANPDKFNDLKQKILLIDPDKIFQNDRYKGFICPICGSGSGRHGTGFQRPKNAVEDKNGFKKYRYFCFVCGNFKGDLLNIIANVNGLDLTNDFLQIMAIGKKILESAYNGNFDDISPVIPPVKTNEISDDEFILIKDDLYNSVKNFDHMPATADFTRGISIDVLKKIRAGYLTNWIHPDCVLDPDKPKIPSRRLIIPCDSESYDSVMPLCDRNEYNQKFKNLHAGTKTELFSVYSSDGRTSFKDFRFALIFEGSIDALSAYEVNPDYWALASLGTTNLDNTVNFLNRDFETTDERFNFQPIVIFDNETTAQEKSRELVDALKKCGYPAISLSLGKIGADKVDANSILMTDGRDALKSKLAELVTDAQSRLPALQEELKAASTDDKNEYDFQNFFTNHFDAEIDKLKKYADRKTGFGNLDEVQKFLPGIYLIGALPGAGKTTFCWQMANQLADNGENIIYLTNEMSPLELFVKSLTRELYQRDKSTALTSTDIKLGAYSPILDAIKTDFKTTPKPLKVLDVRSKNIDDILKSLEHYCTGDTDKAPIFFVDYLQIISALDSKQSEYDKLNDIAKKLKDFQKQTNTTFIIISSFNRANYYTDTAMDAFKGSGNLEYTADGLLKLAVDIPTGATISDAMKLQPRNLKLTCLKNRNGNFYECKFDYFSAHDYFCPADSPDGKRGKVRER